MTENSSLVPPEAPISTETTPSKTESVYLTNLCNLGLYRMELYSNLLWRWKLIISKGCHEGKPNGPRDVLRDLLGEEEIIGKQ